jgi:HK97 family phage portal protein
VKIVDSIRSFLGFEKRETIELNVDDKRLLELLGVEVGAVNVKGKNALKIDTLLACIRILSGSVSKLPLKVYIEDENGVKKATSHYLYKVLKLRPNPYMSASDFWKAIESQRAMGNAYASIEFDKKTGRVKALWPIDSSKVTMMVDNIGLVGPDNRIWYEIEVSPGIRRKVSPDEILHFKGNITLDGLIGIPT